MSDSKRQVSIRLAPHTKDAGHELAERRGTTLSGMLEGLLRAEIAQDRAEVAVLQQASSPALGGARGIATRLLTGACLHPPHLRERWGVQERCTGCGQHVGSLGRAGHIDANEQATARPVTRRASTPSEQSSGPDRPSTDDEPLRGGSDVPGA